MATLIAAYEFMHLLFAPKKARNGWKVNFNAAQLTWHANSMANETRQQQQGGEQQHFLER